MNKSTKIKCPNCQSIRIKEVLGEVLENGDIQILRSYHNSNKGRSTIVRGNDFMLICGRCRESAYLKKGGSAYEYFKSG